MSPLIHEGMQVLNGLFVLACYEEVSDLAILHIDPLNRGPAIECSDNSGGIHKEQWVVPGKSIWIGGLIANGISSASPLPFGS